MAKKDPSDGWFSISSAPRDGTPIILWMIEDGTRPMARGLSGTGPRLLRLASAIGVFSGIRHGFAWTHGSAVGVRSWASLEHALE